jgi:hypothetical protein
MSLLDPTLTVIIEKNQRLSEAEFITHVITFQHRAWVIQR